MAATVHASIVFQEPNANKPRLPASKALSEHPIPTTGTKPNAEGKKHISCLSAQIERLMQGAKCTPSAQCTTASNAKPHQKLPTTTTTATRLAPDAQPQQHPPHPTPAPEPLASPFHRTPTRSPRTPAPPAAATPPPAARRRHAAPPPIPRVDSLPFAMDDDDLHTARTPPDQDPKLTPQDLLAVESIRRAAQPTSPSEHRLAIDVADAYLHPLSSHPPPPAPPPDMLPSIARHLDLRSYTVHIKTAIGGGIGRTCFQHQPHTFLQCGTVRTLPSPRTLSSAAHPHPGSAPSTLTSYFPRDACPSPPPERLVVDPHLRDQFVLARPTKRYTAVLAAVPAVFVGTEERLAALVDLLSAEVALSFKARGLHLPPWREAANIISKWLPSRFTATRTSSLPVPAGAAPSGAGDVRWPSPGARGGGDDVSVLRPTVSIRYFKLPGGVTL